MAEIQERLRRLDGQRKAFAARLSGWSEERLKRRPEPQVWSALDILDHLVRVDTDVLMAIQENLLTPSAIGLRDRLGALMVTSVMLSPIRVKVPASATGVMPQQAENLAELMARWDRTHRDYSDLAANLSTDQLRFGVFRHPVAGWMSFTGALRFLSTHLRHHVYQLRRLQKTT